MGPLQILKELIRIPSVSRKESTIAQLIASLVDGKIQNIACHGKPCGSNVVAISEPHPGKPFILLNGHHDTVAPTEGWDSDPFIPELRGDDRLYGLGSHDMKAGLAINISLFNEFRDDHNLIFTSADDEESDSLGSFALTRPKDGPISHILSRISGVLITEPTYENVMLGARGRYAIKMVVHGRSSHGARPYQGVNAVDRASEIVLALRNMPIDHHPVLGNGSYCVLGMSGGTETLSVPDRCELIIDRHLTEPQTREQVIAEFRQIVDSIDRDQGGTEKLLPVDIDLVPREVPFLEPYVSPSDHPFVKQFIDSVANSPHPPSKEPVKPRIIYGESVGDYNIFGGMFPTVVFGPDGGQHHAANEYTSIRSIRSIHEKLRFWLGSMIE